MSLASEFPPEVFIPSSARPRALRRSDPPRRASAGLNAAESVAVGYRTGAGIDAVVVQLDGWRRPALAPEVEGLAQALARHPAKGRVGVALSESVTRTAPTATTTTPSLRLTHRGARVLALVSVASAAAIVAVAWLCAPAGLGAATVGSGASTVVTVQAGDSLWSIATAAAPTRDPRAEVDQLRRMNHLSGDAVIPGQTLRIR